VNTKQPLFFAPNRVRRRYTGGALIDRFRSTENETDNFFPEDWLASTVLANNGERSSGPDEGLARVSIDNAEGLTLKELLLNNGERILGNKHFLKYGQNTAVLCKYLDSSIRLPIQCHPDAMTAMNLYNSPFGKTESWHIIATRKISGEEPFILLGFKPGITLEKFAKTITEQNIQGMINLLHRIPVHPGETYFVPARMPHAIGSGVFMLEVQEPSDWVIQTERYCAGNKLIDKDMWGSLSPDQGLQVFDYQGYSEEELLKKVTPSNRVIHNAKDISVVELIGPEHTKAFGLWRVTLKGKAQIKLPTEFAIVVVEKGTGTLKWSGGSKQIKQSDYFLKPAELKELEYCTDKGLELLVCLPPYI
jgi:mannose-6-phosphate isomerase